MQKKCPECHSRNTKKNGRRNRKQCYKCFDCGKRWGGTKTKDNKWVKTAYLKYASDLQTLEDLSGDLNICQIILKKWFGGWFFHKKIINCSLKCDTRCERI